MGQDPAALFAKSSGDRRVLEGLWRLEWVNQVWGILQTPPGILISAALLDFVLGDPWGWPHPVQWMGYFIQGYCNLAWKGLRSRRLLRLAGVGLTLLLMGLSGIIGWSVIFFAKRYSPPLGWIVEVILLASCFAGRSLRAAAEDVIRTLRRRGLEAARSQLSKYVGRDTDDLSEPEVLRAILETIAENATDGVMAPLFYAAIGLFIPDVGAVPLALAYKAASTLDSMVGYRKPPYADIGWFSARFEDALTWVPCRCHVISLGLLSGQLRKLLRACTREAIHDPSPNSGWSECAYATLLGVQLGGFNSYHGVVTFKPFLGKNHNPITTERIGLALRFVRNCFVLWMFFIIVLWLFGSGRLSV
jgi:adenosylcobinamide-phosphate synthase